MPARRTRGFADHGDVKVLSFADRALGKFIIRAFRGLVKLKSTSFRPEKGSRATVTAANAEIGDNRPERIRRDRFPEQWLEPQVGRR